MTHGTRLSPEAAKVRSEGHGSVHNVPLNREV